MGFAKLWRLIKGFKKPKKYGKNGFKKGKKNGPAKARKKGSTKMRTGPKSRRY